MTLSPFPTPTSEGILRQNQTPNLCKLLPPAWKVQKSPVAHGPVLSAFASSTPHLLWSSLIGLLAVPFRKNKNYLAVQDLSRSMWDLLLLLLLWYVGSNSLTRDGTRPPAHWESLAVP